MKCSSVELSASLHILTLTHILACKGKRAFYDFMGGWGVGENVYNYNSVKTERDREHLHMTIYLPWPNLMLDSLVACCGVCVSVLCLCMITRCTLQMGLDGTALEQVLYCCLPYLSQHQPSKLQEVHGL